MASGEGVGYIGMKGKKKKTFVIVFLVSSTILLLIIASLLKRHIVVQRKMLDSPLKLLLGEIDTNIDSRRLHAIQLLFSPPCSIGLQEIVFHYKEIQWSSSLLDDCLGLTIRWDWYIREAKRVLKGDILEEKGVIDWMDTYFAYSIGGFSPECIDEEVPIGSGYMKLFDSFLTKHYSISELPMDPIERIKLFIRVGRNAAMELINTRRLENIIAGLGLLACIDTCWYYYSKSSYIFPLFYGYCIVPLLRCEGLGPFLPDVFLAGMYDPSEGDYRPWRYLLERGVFSSSGWVEGLQKDLRHPLPIIRLISLYVIYKSYGLTNRFVQDRLRVVVHQTMLNESDPVIGGYAEALLHYISQCSE